jgi:probable rRNA maturation factor
VIESEPTSGGLTVAVLVDEEYESMVDLDRLREAALAMCHRLGVDRAELSVAVTDDQEVRRLNLLYRGVDAPTDVLSFPASTGDEMFLGVSDELRRLLAEQLGDVIIAFPYAAQQAKHFGNPVADELLLLTVHGVLHLLGYDHDSAEEEQQMWALQEEILSAMGVSGLSERSYDN